MKIYYFCVREVNSSAKANLGQQHKLLRISSQKYVIENKQTRVKLKDETQHLDKQHIWTSSVITHPPTAGVLMEDRFIFTLTEQRPWRPSDLRSDLLHEYEPNTDVLQWGNGWQHCWDLEVEEIWCRSNRTTRREWKVLRAS